MKKTERKAGGRTKRGGGVWSGQAGAWGGVGAGARAEAARRGRGTRVGAARRGRDTVRGGASGQGNGDEEWAATRSGRRGGDGEHGQPGGVDELGVVGGQMFDETEKFTSPAYIRRALVPVHGSNREQCPFLVPVGATNRDQRYLFSSPKRGKQRPLVPVGGTNRD